MSLKGVRREELSKIKCTNRNYLATSIDSTSFHQFLCNGYLPKFYLGKFVGAGRHFISPLTTFKNEVNKRIKAETLIASDSILRCTTQNVFLTKVTPSLEFQEGALKFFISSWTQRLTHEIWKTISENHWKMLTSWRLILKSKNIKYINEKSSLSKAV